MSEIKPYAYYVGALNAFTTSKDESEKMGKQFPVESLYPAAAYEALQKENAELKESSKLLDEMLSKVIDERNNAEKNMCKFRAENAQLKAALASSCDAERSQIYEACTGGGCNRAIDAENNNAAQAKRIEELENDLVEWNEFKKIRDAQMQALRKQMP